MILVLLLAAQPVFVPMMTPIPTPTPESRTAPIQHLDCHMVNESGAPFAMVVRREGGQGYPDETVLPGKPWASQTAFTFRILEDGTGLLSKMKFQERGSLRRIGDTFSDELGTVAVFNADISRQDKADKAVLSLYVYHKAKAEPQIFAGPCKVTRIEQKPLEQDPEKGRPGA